MSLVYLDHAATTPMRPAAVEAMLPFLTERFANPSGSHRFARDARQALDEARDQVAGVLGVAPGEVIFTSCATEADSTVVVGTATDGTPGTAVCSAAEHHAVLHPIERRGGTVVGVDATGHINVAELESAVGPETRLVSVMAVNNEVGTVTDLAAVARVVRRHAPDAILHSDAVQAPHWLDVRSIAPSFDAMSFSAHKFGGPKGVGVLTVRDGVELPALIEGGGQERERRSGTHNVGGIVAAAVALTEADRDRAGEIERLGCLRDELVDELVDQLGGVHETVPRPAKVAGSAHLCIEGVESESLLYLLDQAEVAASAASACASGAMEPSHVLDAMGVDRELARGALRLSLGATTSAADIERGIAIIIASVRRLRDAAARQAQRGRR